jgi:hypothetical protein
MADKPRTITVADGRREVDIPLTTAGLADLISKGLVYDCGDGHDLHLDPCHDDWTLEDAEALLLAIDRAAPVAPDRANLPADFSVLLECENDDTPRPMSFRAFCLHNIDGLDRAEIMAIQAALARGEAYRRGGGAAPEWSLRPAPKAAA